MSLTQQIADITGQAVTQTQPLSGGMIGQVQRIDLANGTRLVAKTASGDMPLAREGYMLRYLRQHGNLPVPDVLHSDDTLLLMDYIEGSSSFNGAAEAHAADLLADLHSIHADTFGLEQDTLIGGLHQPNPPMQSWVAFFRDQRLLYMAGVAHDAGRLPEDVYRRVEQLAGRLDNYLEEPESPALLHGDVWTTNVLAQNGRITAFLDPGIYYGHPEVELAFITLFNTFGRAFFDRYQEHRPISPGFFEQRRDLYNLYPLLVHVRLFGGGYVGSVRGILKQLGV